MGLGAREDCSCAASSQNDLRRTLATPIAKQSLENQCVFRTTIVFRTTMVHDMLGKDLAQTQLNDIRRTGVRCLHFAILWSLEDELAQDNKTTISHAAPVTGAVAVGHSGACSSHQVGWPVCRADQGRPVGISCLTMTKTTELDDSHHDESSAVATSRCSSCLSRTTQATTIAPTSS